MSRRRLLVEADGGSRGNPGPAAYGAVLRDPDTGQVLAEVAEHIGRATNNVAEYRGLIAGLELARRTDPDAAVEARMDSKLVVEQMAGRWKIKHPDLRPLAVRAQRLAGPDVTYTWVPRAQNAHADRLANEALDAAARGEAWVPATDRADAAARAQPQVDEAEPLRPVLGARTLLAPPTTLLLARHGETELTAARAFSGRGGQDPPLTPTGRAQARALAEVVAGIGDVAAVVASPLRRTRETAEAVATRLGVPVQVDEGWEECAFGAWDGLTFAEVQDRWPEELAGWLASTTVAPPGGESFDAVAQRVHAARDRLLRRYAGARVLVVSHATPVKQVVRLALDAPGEAVFRLDLRPAALCTLDLYPDGNASLRSWNDTGHLR